MHINTKTLDYPLTGMTRECLINTAHPLFMLLLRALGDRFSPDHKKRTLATKYPAVSFSGGFLDPANSVSAHHAPRGESNGVY